MECIWAWEQLRAWSEMDIIVRVQVNKCVQPALAVYIVALSHAIRNIAPAPVVEYTAPTPIVRTAPTPVVEYIDLIPAVSCVAPALVVEYVACSGFRYLSNIVTVVSLGFAIYCSFFAWHVWCGTWNPKHALAHGQWDWPSTLSASSRG